MSSLPAVSRRAIVVAAAIVLVAVAVFALLGRRALRPGLLRPIAEAQLSQVLNRPVTVGSLDVDLFPRPQVIGGDITLGSGATQAAPSLHLRAVRMVPRLAPLLSGRLVIDLVQLEGLALMARRDAGGRWHLPFGAGSQTASPAAGARPPGSTAPAPPAATAVPASAGGSPAGSGSGVEVGEIRVADGRLVVVDDVLRSPAGSPEVAALTDIEARIETGSGGVRLTGLTARLGEATVTGEGRASGEGLLMKLTWDAIGPSDLPEIFGLAGARPVRGLAVEGKRPLDLELSVGPAGSVTAKGTLRADTLMLGTLTMTGVEAPFIFDGRKVDLNPIVLRAYGGVGKGRFGVSLGPPPTWALVSSVVGVDVNAFLSANTSARDRLSATGRFDVNLRAAAGAPLERALAGTIDARLVNGVIHDFALLAAINRGLGLTGGESNDTAFDELSATLTVGGGKASTERLVLRMGEMTLSAAGTLGFDQSLDLEGQVTLSPAKTAELTRRAGELRNLRLASGELEVPLTVTGTVSEPRFYLDLARMLKTAAKYQFKRQLEKFLKRVIKNDG